MSARLRRVVLNDPSRFEGNGISYKAKLIGIEDVKEARGDLMCQEAMIKLKNSVKISGEHKRKIFVNVTLEGLRIIDAISLASLQNKKKIEPKSPKLAAGNGQTEPGQDGIVLHIHPVHRISFISRDTTDTRAFGYVFGTEDGLHKFFAIKTASAAENLVLALRDLFQVVYEMKKKEVEAAKEKLDKQEHTTNGEKENLHTSGPGSISGTGQTQTQKVNAEPENIYQVPTNNAPISPGTHAEQVANLLDLEDQAEHILKGIEQIKNLEFDSVEGNSFASSVSAATSPLAKLSPSMSSNSSTSDDPWGLSTATAPNSSSSLGDLSGLQSGTFQQSFASIPFPVQSGFSAAVAFNSPSAGLPLTQDPFSSDPFGSAAVQQPRLPVSPGFGMASPYAPGFGQPYGMQAVPPRLGMMPGMVPRGMMSPPIMGAMRSPFFVPQPPVLQMGHAFGEDPNILQPMKKDGRQDANPGSLEPVKSPTKTREDLFGDLLNIRKSAPSTAKSPKDMFAQMNAPGRKPMNEMKASFPVPAGNQQSQASGDPFGDLDSVSLDRTRGLLLSDAGDEDPFDTSFIPPLLAESSHHAESLAASTIPPPVPSRQPSSHNHTSHADTSYRSPMPSSPPPPPPASLPLHATPAPPHRPHKSDTFKDINENITSYACDIHASNQPPSPIEPPPPLPPHVLVEPSSCAPASPSTPRPHVQCVQTVAEGISDKSPRDMAQSNLSHTSSLTHKENVFESHTSQPVATSDVPSNLSDDQSAADIVQICNCLKTLPALGRGSNTEHSHQSAWVGFENCEDLSLQPCAFISSPLHTAGVDDDPFNVPFHLTPGFKAVAKFGSDPFDDCLSGSPFDDCLSGPFSEDAWDPFPGVEPECPEADPGSSVAASKSLFD